ncbi:phage tail protein [Shigella sonnei]|nr:phage tail protein [Shigella sonnei]
MTDAGRQELVNANKTGINKVEIVSVGLGSRYYVTSTSQTNITDEIKRLTTIGGKVVSPDTIHVTAKDDSKDEYVVHTIGLYTNKGTLFAVYSQEQAIINKASSTIALISSDIAIKTLDTKNITFGDIEFINPPATETVVGVARFANEQEIDAGTDDSLAVSAKRLKQAIVKHEQSRNHPDATLTSKGFVQLSSATNSTSETLAATPKAVKAAYDLANAKYTAQDATTARKGIVQLSSATNSDSETLAATPKAVKAAYDLANAKYTAQDATTARKGIVQLSSATNSTSETLAATSKAVKVVMDETNKKAPLNSPALSGTPTTPTATKGTNNTQIASTAFVMAAIAELVDSSPDALNTLNELAAALGNDPNFATTMTNALAGKQPKDATLTALAELATSADKLPYFTGADRAALTALTSVGRAILGKTSTQGVLDYLGLGEGSALPVGVPVPWPSATPPTGWLKCNGAAFSAEQYPELAKAYPTNKLPDLRGEFIRGWDDGRGIDTGREMLSYQEGTIVSGFDDNDTGDISSLSSTQYGFGDTLTSNQWASISGKKWIFDASNKGAQKYDWWAYVSARPRNIAFNYIVRAA